MNGQAGTAGTGGVRKVRFAASRLPGEPAFRPREPCRAPEAAGAV